MTNTEQQKETLVAVYGTLKSGHGNHRLLEHKDVIYLGTDNTKEKFDMYSFGGFPAIVEGGDKNIFIEVYSAPNKEVLDSLDRLEGFRGDGKENFYDKKEIETKFGKAFIYYIKDISKFNVKKINKNNW